MADQRDLAHATLDDLCEVVQEADGDPTEPLLFKYDDVYLDVESFTRTTDGALVIHLQEA